ncbi:uncharacterized protein CXQ87_000138 [Candidozyma duobushaemuli]|uniref:IMP-specific 5'-nucleotidase 1 n=1 Tax=Candidozyma duobushaemuli TaxID=1231522 RepID=A0A2V1AI10_9ASCO|nr:uncharacterized protein CXQ87_000138 [[Candida] duobushaemulonis]PVH17254.1 hypothetical protein CXQ87_000138 [[Candida] duobushaemulonis]
MTSRYRVEYALKKHKRDEFIEWIKSLLAVPFVLHADLENYEEIYSIQKEADKFLEMHEQTLAKTCKERYMEVFMDVEKLIDSTRYLDSFHSGDGISRSRLRQLVPSVGRFFTRLPLKEAFEIEDTKKSISRRRLVSPSFNDVRSILNTAQVLALTSQAEEDSRLKLITFDGDVTLYDDGKSLLQSSPLVDCLVELLAHDIYVAVVTAAGYPGESGALEYHKRLPGLIEVLRTTDQLTDKQKSNFLVMGGESNYLFRFDVAKGGLQFIEADEWYLPLMRAWDADKIVHIMNASFDHLVHLQKKFSLDDENKTTIIRKERSLGIIPTNGYKISRETLEEIVLSLSTRLHDILYGASPALPDESHHFTSVVAGNNDSDLRVCAFNGGSDVWVDIGDKSLGVEALQHYLCKDSDMPVISKSESLHIGDQFASVGANDFKARLSACTVWIASPKETEEILFHLIEFLTGESTLAN